MKRLVLPKRLPINTPLLAAVFLPVLLTAAVLGFTCAIFGLYPFGDGSLCWCDMRQQGLPLLMMLRNAILSGDSLVYMPGLAGGADFSGVAAFFLMNPGSLLAVFWKPEHLLDLLNLLVFGKLLLCAASSGWFFYRRFPENGVGFATAFSVAYALCGYGLLYYQNLMWLDVMALFPLLLLACYALLERGRPMPYIVLMTLSMVACFYIGFMVALFALLFFGIHLWLCRKNRLRTAVQFLLGSFAAALLAAPVWIPAFCQVLASARGTSLSESLTACGWGVPFATSLPLLLCSAGLPLLLIVTAMFFPRWNRKTAALGALCGLMLIPMFLEPVNRMWHMGSYMCFPCRFAFIPIFLLLTLVAHLWAQSPLSLGNRRAVRIAATATVGVAVVALGVFLVFVFKKNAEAAARYLRTLWGDAESLKVHLLVFAAVALVAAVWATFFRTGWLKKPVAAVLLCGLVLCESTFYCAIYIGKVPDYWQADSFSAVVDLADKTDSNTFSRVKTSSDMLDSNMIGALGYPSLGGYTSFVTEDALYTAKKLGYTANWLDIGLNGGTLFSDMLLSTGYTVNHLFASPTGNDIVYSNDVYRLEKLPYTLPLGFLTNEATATSVKTLPNSNRLQAQETLAAALFGESNLFTRYAPVFWKNCTFASDSSGGAVYSIDGQPPIIVYSFSITDRQTLYFDCFDAYTTKTKEPIFGSFSVTVNGKIVEASYPNAHESGFLNLGTFENQPVVISLTPLKSGNCASFGVFGLHHDALNRISSHARTADITYDGRAYVGTFIAERDDCLLLTVPYLKGFTATVDGKHRDVEKTMDGFIRVPLQSGESAVRLTYSPPGLVLGIVLCILGIALLVLCRIFRRAITQFCASHAALLKKARPAAFFTAVGASALCVIVVYLFPVLYKLLNS